MDNTSEDILYIIKEEMFLVCIFNTPVCCGKTKQNHGEVTVSMSDQESLVFGMLYTVWV